MSEIESIVKNRTSKFFRYFQLKKIIIFHRCIIAKARFHQFLNFL